MAEPNKSRSDSYNLAAIDLTAKVDLYFLALTFTVAGLAVQSAKFSGDHLQWGLEILAWVCLITAATVALIRMQHAPRTISYAGAAWGEEDEGRAADYGKESKRINEKITTWGTVQLWVFVAGVVLVAASHAYAGMGVAC